MLKEIQTLGDSVTRDQIEGLKKALGDNLYNLLDFAFDSEEESEAKDRIDAFVSLAKRSPLKILKARKLLTGDQKSIIMKFLGD